MPATVIHTGEMPLIPKIFQGLKVIDTDTHWTEPPDFWAKNAPAKYKDRVPHIVRIDGADTWVIEKDTKWGGLGGSVVRKNGDKLAGTISDIRFENLHPAGSEVKARLALRDAEGITYQILYPNSVGFQGNRFMELKDTDFRLSCVQQYNTTIIELQQESGGRLLPQALVVTWDPDEMLKELKRCKDLGFTGVTVGDKPELLGVSDFTQPHWAPFWDFCNQSGLVINFHIGGSSAIDAFATPWESYGVERSLALAATIFYMSNAATLGNLVFSELFDTYENVKIASVESGVGWIPFVLDALEYQMDEMIPTEMVNVKGRPTDYFKKHIYACTWFEEQSLAAALSVLGDDNIMYMSDFPHPTCLYPDALGRTARGLAKAPASTARKIMQDTPARVYGVKI